MKPLVPRGWPAAWVVLLLASASSTQAVGQEAMSDDPASADVAARARFQQGVALFRAGDNDGALSEFQAAFEIGGNPSVRYNIGVCLFNLGRGIEARSELLRYLTEADPERITDQRREEVDLILGQIEASIALVDLQVSQDGVQVNVDGQSVGTSPFGGAVALPPGEHVVTAALAGYEPYSATIEVAAGERVAVDVVVRRPETVTPMPPVPPPLVGTQESAEAADAGISPIWFWTSVGLAGALAISGTITGALVEKDLSDYQDRADVCNTDPMRPEACDEALAIADEGEALGAATTGLLIVAGAAAAAALTLGFFTDFGGGETEESPDALASVTLVPVGWAESGTPTGVMLSSILTF